MTNCKSKYLKTVMAVAINPTSKEEIAIDVMDCIDILSAALPSIGYWATIDYNKEDYKKSKDNLINERTDAVNELREINFETVLFNIMAMGGKIKVYDNEDEDEIIDLTLEKFTDGIVKAIQEDYITSDDVSEIDGEIADAVIQYSLFDSIVYG